MKVPSARPLLAEGMREAVDAETAFAADVLGGGVAGLSQRDMRAYLESVADQRLVALGGTPVSDPVPSHGLGFAGRFVLSVTVHSAQTSRTVTVLQPSTPDLAVQSADNFIRALIERVEGRTAR